MKLFKIRNGLLEWDNYYETTPFNDLLGYGSTHRELDTVVINTNNEINRRIDYPNYMVEIEKENWSTGLEGDEFLFYVGNTHQRFGTKDYFHEEQHEFHRIVYLDKFVECYVSHDRTNWVNVGGLDISDIPIDSQGIRKVSENSLRLKNYGVYHDPFLTVRNFPENFKIKLYNSDGVLLKERLFTNNEEVDVFLDQPLQNAYMEIYDTDGLLVFTSDRMDITYGDMYALIEYELEAIYKGRILPEGEITPMDSHTYSELVSLKNTSDYQTYVNLTVGTEIETGDIIELSIDNVNFSDTVVIPEIVPLGIFDVYVKITRGNTGTYVNRNFLLTVQ
jgi:hypothetical protein